MRTFAHLVLLTAIPVSCVLLGPSSASAQEGSQATALVEAPGEASIEVPPAFADFVFEWVGTRETFEQVGEAATGVPAQLREALATAGVAPATFEDTGTQWDASADSGGADVPVVVRMRVRYALSGYRSEETGLPAFGRLVDALQRVADATGCTLLGPILRVSDEDVLVREAVAAATAEAYTAGEAVAQAMQMAVPAIDSVSVLEIRWNDGQDTGFQYPNFKAVRCTARVAVRYIVQN